MPTKINPFAAIMVATAHWRHSASNCRYELYSDDTRLATIPDSVTNIKAEKWRVQRNVLRAAFRREKWPRENRRMLERLVEQNEYMAEELARLERRCEQWQVEATKLILKVKEVLPNWSNLDE
jgi:hypothetical protein